ncbi:MAG TPA: radical SAM protein [bacterium]|nr:radical SAM protein [bacterium]
MNVVFCQPDFFIYLGQAHLAAALRAAGHRARVLIARDPAALAANVRAARDDLVAFSLTTGRERWARQAMQQVRQTAPHVRLIAGGPHATFFPEFIEQAPVDALCRGEGEAAIVAYADGEDPARIANLWARVNGKIVRNDLGPLPDLNVLPPPDLRVYFDAYPRLRRFYRHVYPMIAGRGCPNACAYCFNEAYRALHRGLGPVVRRRSFAHLAAEIEEARARYGITQVYFQDDCFLSPPSWFADFAAEYPRRIGLPYYCLVRAETIDEPTAQRLADSGCAGVTIGVETGDETVRRELLNKPLSNRDIVAAVERLHRRGVSVQTDIIFGLPGLGLDEALQSYRFVNELRSDFGWSSLFNPYPGTAIERTVQTLVADETSRWSYRTRELPASYFDDTILTFPHRREIINLHRLFALAVRLRLTEKTVRRLIALPLDPLYRAVRAVTFHLGIRRIKRLPWPAFLAEAARVGASALCFRRQSGISR